MLAGNVSLTLGGRNPEWLCAKESTSRGPARAKRCLMLFLWGGPAHQDLWDMKPLAPSEYRGEFQPIPTVTPGIEICEHLPHLAKQTDKICFLRSLTHSDNNHSTSAHWMLTGHKHSVSAENFNARGDDFPHIGSVLTKLSPSLKSLPTFVALPEQIATTIGAVTPGQGGGILGAKYDPFRIDQHPDEKDFEVPNLSLPTGVTTDRMDSRMALLSWFDRNRPPLDGNQREAIGAFQTRAIELLTSTHAQQAFDLQSEPASHREKYGTGTFGQGLLLARRLLEAGVKLVTVYWHRDDPGVDTTWDTHSNNFGQLKDRLIPQVDRPIATLLQDLEDRGMLEDTLVIWNSEFGRTPKINNNRAGRDHWGKCNTVWLAGAGIPGGTVHGRSDSIASAPDDYPISPEDFTATIYHLLGLNPRTEIYDRLQRPFPLSDGRVLHEIL
ncbi:MAG: DUF1501 domain-containing protein [Planctomycetaceae bacterium]|nr:DUF1501 domain-containing protein [Planctomycetaceae bacterium]